MTIRIPVWLRANILLLAIEGSVFPAGPALAQAPPGAPPGACTMPVSQRTSEVGCYLTATEVLGALPQGAQFWHLYNYPTRAAAEAVKGPHGTVVQSFGKVWLYTIADANWRPAGGDRIAVIGPLQLAAGIRYTARYMEAVFTAGMDTPVHLHSGAEAWYLLAGAQCLETPDGITVLRAGEGGLVPQGPPMRLSSVGAEMRRSVLLVLHDTSQPWITYESDWKPKGLCPK
jgi:mannose-6-phosphate isomerase-like protein (cupin superfamily)